MQNNCIVNKNNLHFIITFANGVNTSLDVGAITVHRIFIEVPSFLISCRKILNELTDTMLPGAIILSPD